LLHDCVGRAVDANRSERLATHWRIPEPTINCERLDALVGDSGTSVSSLPLLACKCVRQNIVLCSDPRLFRPRRFAGALLARELQPLRTSSRTAFGLRALKTTSRTPGRSRDCAATVASSMSSLARCPPGRVCSFVLADGTDFSCDLDFWLLIPMEMQSLMLNESCPSTLIGNLNLSQSPNRLLLLITLHTCTNGQFRVSA